VVGSTARRSIDLQAHQRRQRGQSDRVKKLVISRAWDRQLFRADRTMASGAKRGSLQPAAAPAAETSEETHNKRRGIGRVQFPNPLGFQHSKGPYNLVNIGGVVAFLYFRSRHGSQRIFVCDPASASRKALRRVAHPTATAACYGIKKLDAAKSKYVRRVTERKHRSLTLRISCSEKRFQRQ